MNSFCPTLSEPLQLRGQAFGLLSRTQSYSVAEASKQRTLHRGGCANQSHLLVAKHDAPPQNLLGTVLCQGKTCFFTKVVEQFETWEATPCIHPVSVRWLQSPTSELNHIHLLTPCSPQKQAMLTIRRLCCLLPDRRTSITCIHPVGIPGLDFARCHVPAAEATRYLGGVRKLEVEAGSVVRDLWGVAAQLRVETEPEACTWNSDRFEGCSNSH